MSWLAVLKVIPWTDVVVAAPTLAKAARHLLNKNFAAHADPQTDLASTPPSTDFSAKQELGLRQLMLQQQKLSMALEALQAKNQELAHNISLLRKRQNYLLGAIVLICLTALGTLASWLAYP